MTEEIKLIGLDFSVASQQVIEILLEDPSEAAIFREIYTANTGRPEILRLLAEHANVPDDVRAEAAKMLHLPAERKEQVPHAVRDEEARKHGLLQKIQTLTVGEKIALALRGGRDVRTILIKDSNKEVCLSVLKNPKMTETEVELVSHSRNIPDEALRFIAKNREWMKNYSVVLALVSNPKTPVGISSTLVPGLKVKDLIGLEKNKNVSEAVRALAKKLVQARKTK